MSAHSFYHIVNFHLRSDFQRGNVNGKRAKNSSEDGNKDICLWPRTSREAACLDRAAEIVEKLEKENKEAEKYIVIQRDEPLFNVETLNIDLSLSIIDFYTHKIVIEKLQSLYEEIYA